MSFQHDDLRDRWDSRYERDRPDPYEPWRGRPSSTAGSAVVAPAVFLIVLAVFNLLGSLVLLGMGAYWQSINVQDFKEQMTEDDPEALDDMLNEGWTLAQIKELYSYVVLGMGAVSLVAALILGLGGLAMLLRKFYGLGFVAAVTAILSPGGCFLFGLIAGIWAIVVLINPDVRKSFT
jgi:hypothetical protein